MRSQLVQLLPYIWLYNPQFEQADDDRDIMNFINDGYKQINSQSSTNLVPVPSDASDPVRLSDLAGKSPVALPSIGNLQTVWDSPYAVGVASVPTLRGSFEIDYRLDPITLPYSGLIAISLDNGSS